MKQLYTFGCLLFLSITTTRNVDARELEVINRGQNQIYICIAEYQTVTQSNVDGSRSSQSLTIQGWTRVPAQSKVLIKTVNDYVELLVDVGGRYAMFRNFTQRKHFIHRKYPFENRVMNRSVQGKERGMIRIQGKPWIDYNLKCCQTYDLPLNYGFVRAPFYEIPTRIKVLNINQTQQPGDTQMTSKP